MKLYLSSLRISLPEAITEIERHTFAFCESLESIDIPETVTSIGENAFDDTGFYLNENNWEERELYISNYLIKVLDTKTGTSSIKTDTYCMADDAYED